MRHASSAPPQPFGGYVTRILTSPGPHVIIAWQVVDFISSTITTTIVLSIGFSAAASVAATVAASVATSVTSGAASMGASGGGDSPPLPLCSLAPPQPYLQP